MKNVAALLQQCRALGATLVPLGDHIRVRAPAPLPEELIADLRELKSEVLAELGKERAMVFDCWVLDEWRRVSIPAWRRILSESIEKRDSRREEYARWMLREILQDGEYEERIP